MSMMSSPPSPSITLRSIFNRVPTCYRHTPQTLHYTPGKSKLQTHSTLHSAHFSPHKNTAMCIALVHWTLHENKFRLIGDVLPVEPMMMTKYLMLQQKKWTFFGWLAVADLSVTNAMLRVGRRKRLKKHKKKLLRGSYGWWDVSDDWQWQIRVNIVWPRVDDRREKWNGTRWEKWGGEHWVSQLTRDCLTRVKICIMKRKWNDIPLDMIWKCRLDWKLNEGEGDNWGGVESEKVEGSCTGIYDP